MSNRISKIRKIHSVVSIILFTSLLCFCNFLCQDLKLSEISLSRFGIDKNTNYIWNTSLFIIGILLYIDAIKNVEKFFQNNKYRKILRTTFQISTISLLLTAIINMEHAIHNFTALVYFLGFTISIFIFGYQLLKTDLRVGATSVILSLGSAFFPLLIFSINKSLAIPEIIHCLFIFIWVLTLTFEMDIKNILKKFGL